ncbi:hypothetical protein GRJ2_000528100 [Grus japonensis]|uniref:Reverse transcriptase n=1 Tax=Grus japonensis TaxID=30415 RepID=A0ABC9W5T1_GRUJA
MEDPTPEQVEAPEGGCGPWEAHAGARSWPDRWTREEGSPRRSRFAGRTCDPVGDPTLEQFAPEEDVAIDKVTCLVDEGKPGDVVYLDFSKAFDTISHSILLEKLVAHGLDGQTLCRVKNWPGPKSGGE